MSKDELIKLFDKHIKNTKPKQEIKSTEIGLGKISTSVKMSLGIFASKVHITSFSLKHIYDKHKYKHHLIEEFNFVFKNVRSVIQNPDLVTKNKPSRKGDYCFLKTVNQKTILCSVQILNKKLYVVTAFILKDQGYMKGSSIIWKF